MSLTVYLTVRNTQAVRHSLRIFIREDGQRKEITRAEWDMRFPGKEPFVVETEDKDNEVYSANITHNLGTMAKEAGIYKHLWRPEEIGVAKASQLIEPLCQGIALMKADPLRFEKHNAPNGWGIYEHFVPWLERYLVACEEHADADVSVSR